LSREDLAVRVEIIAVLCRMSSLAERMQSGRDAA
jgi:hypothetical protein